MALAALYAQALEADRRLPQARCFVVDHGVRPESKDDAMNTIEVLRQKCTTSGFLLLFKS